MLQFATAWVEGRALSPAEAIALTREDLPGSDTAREIAVCGHRLTPRETDVLRLVAQGHSNREIAEALFISIPTVKRHLTNILGKLGLPSRSALNTYAHAQGLL